ncbi:MAG: FAD/NAD(P)-binding protein [Rhizomicrobium sp.]
MPPTSKSVAIVGGGFSGALFGMKLHRAQPDWRIVIVEPGRRLGQGIAYGACAPEHLLNVPVSRMEPGLAPRFAQWLQGRSAEMADALAESESDIAAAFAPRYLFGEYMRERLAEVLTARGWSGLQIMRGEAVRALPQPRRGLLLTDGREVEADIVVLAMGNLPPRPPGGPDRWLYDTGYFVPDPWAADALEDVGSDETLLLIGTGLTMVDVVLRLARGGHRGPMIAVSRHGLLPRTHRRGGAWREFLNGRSPASPAALLRLLRGRSREGRGGGACRGSVCSTPRGLRFRACGAAGTAHSGGSSCVICGHAGTSTAIAWRRVFRPRSRSCWAKIDLRSPPDASPAIARRRPISM